MTPTRQRISSVRAARGFSLAETVVSILLVGGLLVAALNTVGSAALGRQQMTAAARGQLLAQQLMAEILLQPYEETVETSIFGRESSEGGGDRALYDDVDDYNGWQSSPPEYKDGTAITNLTGWTRQASVKWADASDQTKVVAYDSGIKMIRVTVLHSDKPIASITAIRTRAGDAIVSPFGTPIGGSN